MLHALTVTDGRAISHRSRSIATDAVSDVIAFGRSIFAFGDGSLALELDARLDSLRRVDLAGARRGVFAHPKIDARTGELHLVASGATGAQFLQTLKQYIENPVTMLA